MYEKLFLISSLAFLYCDYLISGVWSIVFPFILSLHWPWSFHSLALFCLSYSDLREAVEEVLPTLNQQGISVFILSEHCDVEGIESLSDKIQQASDEPLPPQLRANITMKSPALYIYTSGTTGNLAFTSNLCSAVLCSVQALNDWTRTIKIFYFCF